MVRHPFSVLSEVLAVREHGGAIARTLLAVLLSAKGVNPNLASKEEEIGKKGMTAMHYAAQRGWCAAERWPKSSDCRAECSE